MNTEERTYTMAEILEFFGIFLVVVGNTLSAITLDDGFGKQPKKPFLVASVSCYFIGWFILMIAKSITNPVSVMRIIFLLIGIVGVSVSTATAVWFRAGNLLPPAFVTVVTVISWLCLGTSVAIENTGSSVSLNTRSFIFGILAALSMIFSDTMLAPWERRNCITEGYSQILAMLGWWFFTKTN
ncbi:hypothetical protein TetV_546 [Tetraselmis virus 1]|uniref:Uncharacterized protein n=1 Tax=Tetraselmis virus 1 TaxID=2060617 RepID=A0A2P0VNZ1_9VIRU|nr:hypothetical protein QJ968_gp508 [Tetraselmis virus 1]AUF82628.1 hypothetical protein TetV_546 [Tetraselmis virus 1]